MGLCSIHRLAFNLSYFQSTSDKTLKQCLVPVTVPIAELLFSAGAAAVHERAAAVFQRPLGRAAAQGGGRGVDHGPLLRAGPAGGDAGHCGGRLGAHAALQETRRVRPCCGISWCCVLSFRAQGLGLRVLVLLAATEDIAVDGWALTLLSRKHVGCGPAVVLQV